MTRSSLDEELDGDRNHDPIASGQAIASGQPIASGQAIELVRRALAGLRFGEIVIAVHDGEIVQIARTEKIRPPRGTR